MRSSECARAAIKTERGPAPSGHPLRTAFGLFDIVAWPRIRTNRIEAAMNVASKTRKEHTMSNETENKTLPAYRIFSVLNAGSEKAVWQEIGGAWANKDGKGLNLYFKARPLEGAQIVLRAPTETKKTSAKSSRRMAGRYDELALTGGAQ
jgi:hypothetical protein